MIAQFEQIEALQAEHSFLCYGINTPSLDFFWHYHPEYEITYISKGSGKRFIGDHVENYTAGDLVLIGPGLPHGWMSDKNNETQCELIGIQFSKTFVDMLQIVPETKLLKQLFDQADLGLKFIGLDSIETGVLLKRIQQGSGSEKMTAMFQFLSTLTQQPALPIASDNFQFPKGQNNETRIRKALEYIRHNFTSDINMGEAAQHVHLSESAFCKLFKRVMGKTFSDYVNDVRISHASKLLVETDWSIHHIAYECGFNNLTYFNRVFLKKTSIQPLKFRKNSIEPLIGLSA